MGTWHAYGIQTYMQENTHIHNVKINKSKRQISKWEEPAFNFVVGFSGPVPTSEPEKDLQVSGQKRHGQMPGQMVHSFQDCPLDNGLHTNFFGSPL